ncbi:MAG: class I SAM-dependent methyltransferase [Burkholderiaceae bacterium]|nr:class I SAM-dependent methyltransferase [Burkholderiaceae bacterium]
MTSVPAADDPAFHWNRRFDRPEYIFGTTPNEYLASQAHRLARDQRALLVADGEGRNSVWCAQQGLQVDAFDFSPVAVEKARTLAHESGVAVNFTVADIALWPWTPATYDLVAAIFIQFAPPALRAQIFAGCIRTLKPGGTLILQGYTPKQLEFKTGGPPQIEHLYTEALLRDAFAALDIVECRLYEADIHEGPRHSGRSALAGLVATKPLR